MHGSAEKATIPLASLIPILAFDFDTNGSNKRNITIYDGHITHHDFIPHGPDRNPAAASSNIDIPGQLAEQMAACNSGIGGGYVSVATKHGR